MSAARMLLGQALCKGVLLSPSRQSYYNAYRQGQWPWLSKTDRAGQSSRHLWVDLVKFREWCWETGRQLGEKQAQRLDVAIMEAAQG